MLHCEDVVMEIAKFMCPHKQRQTLGLTCERVARPILLHSKTINDLLERNARPECMSSVSTAVKQGHLSCFRYLNENRAKLELLNEFPTDKAFECVCWLAILTDHYDCLRYALKNDYPCDAYDVAMLAERGHLEMLQFAHQHNAPWDEVTCEKAAFNGHLHCLRYAHEHGCPWHEQTIMAFSIHRDDVNCLQYLLENCHQFSPIGMERGVNLAVKFGAIACLRFLHAKKGVNVSRDMFETCSIRNDRAKRKIKAMTSRRTDMVE